MKIANEIPLDITKIAHKTNSKPMIINIVSTYIQLRIEVQIYKNGSNYQNVIFFLIRYMSIGHSSPTKLNTLS